MSDEFIYEALDREPMLLALGRGMQAFASVEWAFGMAFAAMLEPTSSIAAMAILDAARHVEPKLKIIDASAPWTLEHLPEYLIEWRALKLRIKTAQDVRNKLAHWQVSQYPGLRSVTPEIWSQQEVRLVPPMTGFKWGEVIWNGDPAGLSLTVEEVVAFNDVCISLTNDILDYQHRLRSAKNGPAGNVAP